jgi:ribosomal protein L37AE/L43A
LIKDMKIIGHADCYECGQKNAKRLLIIRGRGIWSECKFCGCGEWEWAYGDSLDYLHYLAKKYRVKYEQILEGLEGEPY